MVATWSLAASSAYYSRRTEYYLGSNEPEGVWYAPAGDFGLVDGAPVARETFERLYAAVGADGQPLLKRIRRHRERVPAFDITFSAPRSVSIAWSFAPYETKVLIEAAQYRAVRASLAMLEREATWARRGKGGVFIQKVFLSSALYQHGESRPAKHADGRIFGDQNCHTHAVCLNISTRSDLSVGALQAQIFRNFKMAAGSVYHAALASELASIGFAIDRVGKNGIFELAAVETDKIRYFSARSKEIEDELSEHGVESANAPALAAAIAKATRRAKRPEVTLRREEIWAEAARSIGIDVENFTEQLRDPTRTFDRQAGERLFAARLAALPEKLTEHESVVDRRELVRSVAEALVGTGLPVERVEGEVTRLLREGAMIEIGRDAFGLPRYSTPEMLAIEREVVAIAQNLANRPWHAIESKSLIIRCRAAGLSAEQSDAVLGATAPCAIAIVEGAPGAGKTTTLGPIVEAYRDLGCRVIGTATAWRVAKMLRDDLAIESRATASWIMALKSKSGHRIMDSRTVLIADEAGLLSSREMLALSSAVAAAGGKLLLVGSRQQLQPIGAGPGLDLVSRAVAAARVETIVRQTEKWTREAIADFGKGRAAMALKAFADRGLLIQAPGAKAAVTAVVDEAERACSQDPNGSLLILARTNAAVAAISREVRERRKATGLVTGKEVSFTATTPSGHSTEIRVARGDQIRFLARNDDLGVINGTVANIVRVTERRGFRGKKAEVRIEAKIGDRGVTFDPIVLADGQGRPRIGWAYAATIAGSQGLTVDRAVVFVEPTCNRHDIFVASSRARQGMGTTLVVDAKGIDRRLAAEFPIDRQGAGLVFSDAERCGWLAERLSRASPKVSTLDVIEASSREPEKQLAFAKTRELELDHGL